MAYDYSDLIEKTKRWAKQAHAAGWINTDTLGQLSHFDTRTPDSLFSTTMLVEQKATRPLIVAFMGGTGVGKSTLLNRLAGKPIAKADVVRPTSREVTLYHHQTVTMQHLPEQQLANINVSQHDNAANQQVVWIDMPDFDSTEQRNKQLVFQWLPYIDVLIYVVSPERYKDEKAWRLLLAEGAKHAWLFVFNQWDKGQSGQFDDFNRQLQKVGFTEPVIFKTACSEELLTDEFITLETTIRSLASGHAVEQLEQRGSELRKYEVKTKLQLTALSLGDKMASQQIIALWQSKWSVTVIALQQGFVWSLKYMADYYAEHAADIMAFSSLAKQSLWDEWAQARFDDTIDEFIIALDQQRVPVFPFKQPIASIREKAPNIIQTQTEIAVRMALANPGNIVQRVVLKCLRACEIVLPLMTMSWVGYKVFINFYTSNMGDNHYLGVDFAVHSSLLIALSWLIPFFILKKMQPSLKKSAFKGLNKGLASAFSIIDGEVSSVLQNLAQQHKAQHDQLLDIIGQCGVTDSDKALVVDKETPLGRMLMN